MDIIFCNLKGCRKCGGDLLFDEGDWRCWQCGHYYYSMSDGSSRGASPSPADGRVTPEVQDSQPGRFSDLSSRMGRPRNGPRGRYGARSERNINSVIRAKRVSDDRWRARNRHIIEYLEQGLSVREIARLAGRGERQIRVVRERLADLRTETGETDGSG